MLNSSLFFYFLSKKLRLLKYYVYFYFFLILTRFWDRKLEIEHRLGVCTYLIYTVYVHTLER